MKDLLGREPERAAIEEFLENHDHAEHALVLVGEPGIGKTTLWGSAIEAAADRGFRVLRASPTEAERNLAFATLGDLLAGVHEEIGALPEPQRRALRIALLLEEADHGKPLDERAVGTSLGNLLRGIAGDGVVLIAIDDVQWADHSSWACVRFALRRLDGDIAAVLACRSGFDLGFPVAKVSVGAMADQAVRSLVVQEARGVLGNDDAGEIASLAAGNPMYALEIVRESVAHRRTQGEGATAVRVPSELAAAVLDRADGLPTRTRRELLRLAAGAKDDGLSWDVLRPAGERGLVERTGGFVRYAHPLFASAIYEAASPRERRAVHRALAAAAQSIEDRARHLAAASTGPDEDVASALAAAATRARGRGAIGVAAELALAAFDLSPRDSERRWERLCEAAALQHSVGNLRQARDLLESALAEEPVGRSRAGALLLLGDVLKDSVHSEEALECFREALNHAEDDIVLRATLHANIAYVLQFADGPAAAADDALCALELAEQAGDDALLAQSLAGYARIQFWLGRGVQREAIERALELERGGAQLSLDPRPSLLLAGQLAAAGDLDEARELLRRALGDLRDSGEPVHAVLHRLSLLEHRAGDWDAAELLAREALEEAHQAGERAWERFGLHALATVQAYRGDVAAATESIERCSELAEEIGQPTFVVGGRELLGFLALSGGDPSEAEQQLAPAHRALRDMGVEEPGRYRFLPDEIEALIQIGRLDDADAWIEWLTARAKPLRRDWAIAAADRCRALLLEASGSESEAGATFEVAVRGHEGLPDPFERARTLYAYGAYLRRRRRKAAAREVLDEAASLFRRLRARAWSARADEELARIGGRAATRSTLTPTERRIAERVASGRTNVEVARELFVSPKTVEWNLSKIYRKLRVRSRAELAAKLANAPAAK